MGYTHDWNTPRKFTDSEWIAIMECTAKIITKAKRSYFINLAWELDEPTRKPEVSMEYIRFNGIGDDGHETFLLDNAATEFTFCKTNRKDYDAVVVAVLIAAKQYCTDFDWCSDGWLAEHADGLKLYNEATGANLTLSNATPQDNDPDKREGYIDPRYLDDNADK